MALDTYANLQTAIANWLNRTDLTTPITADFIPAFEARARRELRNWLRGKVTKTNLTAEAAFAAGDLVEAVLGAYLSDGAGGVNNAPLGLVTREELQRLMMDDGTAGRTPVQFCYPDYDTLADTTTMRFYPPISAGAPIASVTFEVMKHLPALALGNNALFLIAPDLYLKGALVEASQFLEHDERIAMWNSQVLAGFAALEKQAVQKEFGGAPRTPALSRVFG